MQNKKIVEFELFILYPNRIIKFCFQFIVNNVLHIFTEIDM